MALVDEVQIHAASGNGGNGVIRWLRTKETARGGPSGGDGGNGGDVYLEGVRDLTALGHYRYEKKFHAENGEAGKSELKHGADGKSVTLKIPIGTIAHVIGTHESYEISREGERVLLFRGGSGGKGNARFRGSTNQNPFHQTDGKAGVGGDIKLTLKLIADLGIVGLPNAGKSSLLNALTNAKSKIGAYPFTTLEPSLGDFHGYIIADIPGLIEGASSGRGLGIKFLKHIERTGFIMHLVSADQENPLATYMEVRKELEAFGTTLSNKHEVIILSKTDLISEVERDMKMELLTRETGKQVLPVTVEDRQSLESFSCHLSKLLKQHIR